MTDFGQRREVLIEGPTGVDAQYDDTDKLAVSTYGKAAAAGDTPILVDANGRPLVDLKLIAGVVPQLDDTDKLAVSIYGKGTSGGDTPLAVKSTSNPNLRCTLYYDGVELQVDSGSTDGLSLTGYGLRVLQNTYLFNGTTSDRQRNNTNISVLAAAARTALTNSTDQTNYNAKGLFLFFSITAVPGTDTVTLTLHAKDPVAGTYETLLTGSAEVGTATRCYLLYPGAGAAANGVDVVTAYPLPRIWRVTITHSGSGSFTYSVGASLIL